MLSSIPPGRGFPVAHEHDVLDDAALCARIGREHDAPRRIHLDAVGPALQLAVGALLHAIVLPTLGERAVHEPLHPLVEVRRLERVDAFVGRLQGNHEIFGKNLAELRGKGDAPLAVDLEMKLAIQVYLGARQLDGGFHVGGLGHPRPFPCCVLSGI